MFFMNKIKGGKLVAEVVEALLMKLEVMDSNVYPS